MTKWQFFFILFFLIDWRLFFSSYTMSTLRCCVSWPLYSPSTELCPQCPLPHCLQWRIRQCIKTALCLHVKCGLMKKIHNSVFPLPHIVKLQMQSFSAVPNNLKQLFSVSHPKSKNLKSFYASYLFYNSDI